MDDENTVNNNAESRNTNKSEHENSTVQNPTNNISAEDLDQETTSKLRGDAIGDTLYSQSFVLKTLLKFSDMIWNEQLEEDLCFLWDMTAEKSVCEYLLEVSFPSIACSAISQYSENRFIEIVIGTLANVLCAGCEKTMAPEEINVVLKELDTDDHLILIQIMRFIAAITFSSKDTPFMSDEVMRKLCFILNNSINTELLLKTLETTSKLSADFKLAEKLVNFELYCAVLTSYHTIINNDSDYFELDTKEKLTACRFMLETVTNICSYVDRYENEQLSSQIIDHCNIFLNDAMKIIKYFSHEENLLPVTDDIIFFMSAFRYIIVTLKLNYVPEMFISLSKLLYIISKIRDEVPELFEAILELECFFISRSTTQRISKDLKLLSKHKMNTVFNIMSENDKKFGLNFDWKELRDVI